MGGFVGTRARLVSEAEEVKRMVMEMASSRNPLRKMMTHEKAQKIVNLIDSLVYGEQEKLYTVLNELLGLVKEVVRSRVTYEPEILEKLKKIEEKAALWEQELAKPQVERRVR